MVSMQISLSLVGILGGSSPVDATVKTLAKMRDEGFRRVWMAQLPYEADLLTVLAVAMREVDTIEVGSGVLPIQVQHPTRWPSVRSPSTRSPAAGSSSGSE